MTQELFDKITDFVWTHRGYAEHNDFDYPFYFGLASEMQEASPEVVDAMQNIWCGLIYMFDTKRNFVYAYRKELEKLGEKIVDKT